MATVTSPSLVTGASLLLGVGRQQQQQHKMKTTAPNTASHSGNSHQQQQQQKETSLFPGFAAAFRCFDNCCPCSGNTRTCCKAARKRSHSIIVTRRCGERVSVLSLLQTILLLLTLWMTLSAAAAAAEAPSDDVAVSPSQNGLLSLSEEGKITSGSTGNFDSGNVARSLSQQHRVPSQHRDSAVPSPPVVLVAPPSPWIASMEGHELQPSVDSGGAAIVEGADGEVVVYRSKQPPQQQPQQPDMTRQHPLAKLQESMRQKKEQEAAANASVILTTQHPEDIPFNPRPAVVGQVRRPSQQLLKQQQQRLAAATAGVHLQQPQQPLLHPQPPLQQQQKQQQQGQESGDEEEAAALLLPAVDHVRPVVGISGEEETLSDDEPLSDPLWQEAFQQRQQQYLASTARSNFAVTAIPGDWHYRRMQQQQLPRLEGATAEPAGVGVMTRPEQQQVLHPGVLAATPPPMSKQQEAEMLFGRGTKVQLLQSRREFEAFVRRVIVEQQRVAVVLFFGRHCPYCIMSKGVFNEAAASVPASLGGDKVVFAAKEVALLEEDFVDDNDEAEGAGDKTGSRRGTSTAEPIEATLDVNYIPQIRVLAPVGRNIQQQQQQQQTGGPGRRSSSEAAAGTMNDSVILAAGGQSGAATEAKTTDHSAKRAGERGTPQIFWLPSVRGKSGTAAGGKQQQEAAYWAGRLAHNEFSSEGIYKYIVEHLRVNDEQESTSSVSATVDSLSSISSTGVMGAPEVLLPATGAAAPTYASLPKISPFKEKLAAEERTPVYLRPVEKALKVLEMECKSSNAPPLYNAVLRRRHEALCLGSTRWDEGHEAATSMELRLHDALATLVYVLRRWVPMGGGKGDRLSREAEAAVQQLLELCRISFPWTQVKKRIFRLQMVLHVQGSQAEPVYPEWREPGGIREGDSSSSSSSVASSGGFFDHVGGWQPQGGRQWGWWHSNVEGVPEREREARRKRKERHSKDGSSFKRNQQRDDKYGGEVPSAKSLRAEGLPKTSWMNAVKHLRLAGIGESNDQAQGKLQLLQCETPLCGTWMLFHVLSEATSAAFRDQVRRAVEIHPEKVSGAAAAADAGSGKDKMVETIDLQFNTPHDNLGTYAVRRYIEILHKTDSSSSSALISRDAERAAADITSKGKRALSASTRVPQEDLGYMTEVLEEELGAIDNPVILQAFEADLQRLHRRVVIPAAMVQKTLRDFVEVFLSCYSCKDHFLQCYHRGFFGSREVMYPKSVVASAAAAYRVKRHAVLSATAAARGGAGDKVVFPSAMWKPVEHKQSTSKGGSGGLTAADVRREKKNYLHLRLWLWRLHNAVNIRTASEATLNAISGHPELFLPQQQWKDANAGKLTVSKVSIDYMTLEQKSLGVGYYIGVDPRWPLRENCASCRKKIKTKGAATGDATETYATQRTGPSGFLLTPEYLEEREHETDICVLSDHYADLELLEVKRHLAQTYWTNDRRPRTSILGVDAFFDYNKRAFRFKY